MMKDKLLDALTRAMNAYLKLDPESPERIAKLHDRVVTLELLPMHWVFQFIFTHEGVDIKPAEILPAETTIKGTPIQLLNVLLTKTGRQRFFADDVHVYGDAELGQQMMALFDKLQIDWTEYLSRFTGDVPAYHIQRAFNSVSHWLQETEQSLAQSINEYVHEEAKWLPAREALQDLFNDIDTLRMDVDRAEAKIALLSAQIAHDDEVTE